jgi:hypothetical protein
MVGDRVDPSGTDVLYCFSIVIFANNLTVMIY